MSLADSQALTCEPKLAEKWKAGLQVAVLAQGHPTGFGFGMGEGINIVTEDRC